MIIFFSSIISLFVQVFINQIHFCLFFSYFPFENFSSAFELRQSDSNTWYRFNFWLIFFFLAILFSLIDSESLEIGTFLGNFALQESDFFHRLGSLKFISWIDILIFVHESLKFSFDCQQFSHDDCVLLFNFLCSEGDLLHLTCLEGFDFVALNDFTYEIACGLLLFKEFLN